MIHKYSTFITRCIFTLTLVTFFSVATSAFATNIHHAPVVAVEPIHDQVRVNTPIERCYNVKSHQPRTSYNSHTPEILGAIVGAAVGHEFGGSKRSKHAAGAVGAILGGSIGRDVDRRRNTRVVTNRQCEWVDAVTYENRVSRYRVTYEYDGSLYTTVMKYHPSGTIPVKIGVIPVN